MKWKAVIAALCISNLALAVSLAGADTSWKERTEKVGDIKIRYLDAGTGDRYLVFIPGWTMTAEIWGEQIPYFAARGYHVISYDPRSQGKTSKTDDGNTYQQHAADLHVFLKKRNIEDVNLIAWDAGVTVLLEYMSSPESVPVDKMILVDGFPKGLRGDDYPGGYTLQNARTIGLGMQQDRKKFTEKWVRGMFKSKQGERLYNEIAEASLKTPIGAAIALLFDHLTGDRRPALRRIRIPALIIAADENRLEAEDMKSRLRSSKLRLVEDVGHALFIEKPQTFNQTVEEFLNEPW